jgi:hypothetical protein
MLIQSRNTRSLAEGGRFQEAANTAFQTRRIMEVHGRAFPDHKIDKEINKEIIQNFEETVKNLSSAMQEAIQNNSPEEVIASFINDLHEAGKALDQFRSTAKGKGHPSQESPQQILGKVFENIGKASDLLVSSMNRAPIVRRQAAGDWVGSQIEEKRKTAEQIEGWGSLVSNVLGGAAAVAIPVFGVPIGIGISAGGNALSKGIANISRADANKLETREAYIQAWEAQLPEALQTSALLKGTSSSEHTNTGNIRDTFMKTAQATTKYGYSVEEGMHVVQEAARQGLGTESIPTAERIFQYARATGSDIQPLTQAETLSKRYSGGDMLKTAFAGTESTGLEKGQYQEFLNVLTKAFEDGIAKGFVKSVDEIALNMQLMSDLSGRDALWTGEQGARKIQQMDNAVSQATGLNTVADIQTFRAASALVQGEEGEKYFNQTMTREDGTQTIKHGGDYIDAMVLMERGISTELVKKQMEIVDQVAGTGKDNRNERVEQIRKMYGFNYTAATEFNDFWTNNKENGGKIPSEEDIKKKIEELKKDPNSFDSESLKLLTSQENLRASMALVGEGLAHLKLEDLDLAGMNNNVQGIYDILKEKMGNQYTNRNISNTLDPFFSADNKDDRPARIALEKAFKDAKTPEEQNARESIMRRLQQIQQTNPVTAHTANAFNTLNAIATDSKDNKGDIDIIKFAERLKETKFKDTATIAEINKQGGLNTLPYNISNFYERENNRSNDAKVYDPLKSGYDAFSSSKIGTGEALQKVFGERVTTDMLYHPRFEESMNPFFSEYKESTDKDSDGGASITNTEYTALLVQLMDSINGLTKEMQGGLDVTTY